MSYRKVLLLKELCKVLSLPSTPEKIWVAVGIAKDRPASFRDQTEPTSASGGTKGQSLIKSNGALVVERRKEVSQAGMDLLAKHEIYPWHGWASMNMAFAGSDGLEPERPKCGHYVQDAEVYLRSLMVLQSEGPTNDFQPPAFGRRSAKALSGDGRHSVILSSVRHD